MNWRQIALKHCSVVRSSNVDKKTHEGEVPVRLINYTDVYYGDRLRPTDDLMEATASLQQVRQFRLQHGDVIITKDSETPEDIGMPAFVEEGADDLVCGYHLAVIRPDKTQVDGRFLCYVMRSKRMRNHLASLARGVTRFGLRLDDIGSVQFECPALSNQRDIADYLDRETARIDTLIAKKQRLIELLEMRFRVWCRSQFDDSTLRRLPIRRMVKVVKTGTTPSASDGDLEVPDGELEWVTPGDFGEWLEVRPSARRLLAKAADIGAVPTFPAGSVLVIGIGATAGRVGFVERVVSSNQQVTALQVQPDVSARCLAWQLWARSDELRATAPYTTMPILNNEFLLGVELVTGPFDEMSRIGARIDTTAEDVRRVVSLIQKQIPKLLECRKALITGAVTGELKVAA